MNNNELISPPRNRVWELELKLKEVITNNTKKILKDLDGKLSLRMIVNMTADENTRLYKLDKTNEEIKNAIDNGIDVYLILNAYPFTIILKGYCLNYFYIFKTWNIFYLYPTNKSIDWLNTIFIEFNLDSNSIVLYINTILFNVSNNVIYDSNDINNIGFVLYNSLSSIDNISVNLFLKYTIFVDCSSNSALKYKLACDLPQETSLTKDTNDMVTLEYNKRYRFDILLHNNDAYCTDIKTYILK